MTQLFRCVEVANPRAARLGPARRSNGKLLGGRLGDVLYRKKVPGVMTLISTCKTLHWLLGHLLYSSRKVTRSVTLHKLSGGISSYLMEDQNQTAGCTSLEEQSSAVEESSTTARSCAHSCRELKNCVIHIPRSIQIRFGCMSWSEKSSSTTSRGRGGCLMFSLGGVDSQHQQNHRWLTKPSSAL